MGCIHEEIREFRSRYGRVVWTHVRSAETIQSDRSGCRECDLLLRVVEKFKPGWLESDGDDVLLNIGLEYMRSVTVRLYETPISTAQSSSSWESASSLSDSSELRIEVASFKYFRRPAEDHLFSENVAAEGSALGESLDVVSCSGSDRAMKRALEWLSQCVGPDDRRRSPNPNFVPTRLIDVKLDKPEQNPSLELGINTKAPFRYACLSYCWGPDSDDVLKTTNENLDTHRKEIIMSLLPKTIQDAIKVCRGLEIPYIWVDSICIIQNNSQDWKDEAARMKDIYANSEVTICALEPDSCKKGFLGTQEFGHPPRQRVVNLTVPPEAGGPSDAIIIRSRPPEEEETESSSRKSSLEKRGWCLQEAVLSPRRLCFDGREMRWDCNHQSICECGHETRTKGEKEVAALLGLIYDLFEDDSVAIGSHAEWRAIVKDYTARSLTNPKDKLPAIAGLRGWMESRMDSKGVAYGEFLAGIWREDFIKGLLWRVIPGNTVSFGPAVFVAPSWSWASVSFPVEYDFIDTFQNRKHKPKVVDHCEIVDAKCVDTFQWCTETSIPFHNAYTGLCGPLRNVRLVNELEHGAAGQITTFVETEQGDRYEVYMDRPQVEPAETDPILNVCCLRIRTLETDVNNMSVYKGRRHKVDAEPAEIWYLVVRQLPGQEYYERLGVGVYTGRLGSCRLFSAGTARTTITII